MTSPLPTRQRQRTPAPAAIGKQETTTVDHEIRSGKQVIDKDQRIDKNTVEMDGRPCAYVRVDGGITKNLGDYNSVKVGVSITRPCKDDDAEIRNTYGQLSVMVEELVATELSVAENKAFGRS